MSVEQAGFPQINTFNHLILHYIGSMVVAGERGDERAGHQIRAWRKQITQLVEQLKQGGEVEEQSRIALLELLGQRPSSLSEEEIAKIIAQAFMLASYGDSGDESDDLTNINQVHMPQLPQLGEENNVNFFTMNLEAVEGFPYVSFENGGIVYKEIGETKFDALEVTAAELILAVESGEKEKIDQALERLTANDQCSDLAKMPIHYEQTIERLVAELKAKPDQTEGILFVKMQLSGIMTSANAISMSGGEGLVLRNEGLLNIHASLLLARSVARGI